MPTFDDDEEAAEERSAVDDEEAARLAALEYGEDGQPMGARSPSPPAADSIAAISLPNAAQHFTPSHLARLPLFLRVHPQQFEHDRYREEREAAVLQEAQDPNMDDKLKEVERRLRCENTVRWKIDEETGKRTSNARFVRWSDGSWTLQVGKEQFDVNGLDSRFAPGATKSNTPAAPATENGSQSASQGVPGPTTRPPSQPLTYIATPTWPEGVYQTLFPLHSNISFQPTSLQSATHRLISQNLSSARARQAVSKVAMSELVAGEKAPEEVKRERERKLADEERKRRLRRKKERGGDIEAEEEAELMGLLKGRRKTLVDSIKKTSAGGASGGKRRLGGGRGAGYDDEDSDEEGGEAGGYMEDDAGDFIVNDEEEDDEDEDAEGEEGTRKAPRRRQTEDDGMDVDDELDPMEQAEMEIEKQEAARAKARKQQGIDVAEAAGAGGDDATQQRKKKAIVESDDDDE